MPSLEQLGMTAAYMNPTTAPLAAMYGLAKNLTAWNNERLAENFREQSLYGLSNPLASKFGPETTFSGVLGNPSMDAKNEDGTGLTPGEHTMGFLGDLQGITSLNDPENLGFGLKASPAISLTSLQDMFGSLSFGGLDSPDYGMVNSPSLGGNFSGGFNSDGTSVGSVGSETSNYGSRQGFGDYGGGSNSGNGASGGSRTGDSSHGDSGAD
jgi:hypothetical protein